LPLLAALFAVVVAPLRGIVVDQSMIRIECVEANEITATAICYWRRDELFRHPRLSSGNA
jgi:hypothetical protein